MADTAGESIDNKTRIEVIRQQEELIKEEAEEKKEVSHCLSACLYVCTACLSCLTIHFILLKVTLLFCIFLFLSRNASCPESRAGGDSSSRCGQSSSRGAEGVSTCSLSPSRPGCKLGSRLVYTHVLLLGLLPQRK